MGAETWEFTVGGTAGAARLDQFLARELAAHASRSRLQRLVGEGMVEVAGRPGRAGQRLRQGQLVRVRLPAPAPSPLAPMSMPLTVCFEDADMLVVVKPAGMPVHPGAGAPRVTLVQGLLAHVRDLSGIGGVLRPGIVHRLDAGTSGLLAVAKNDRAHRALAAQFAAREVVKRYLAVVWQRPRTSAARLDTGFCRHPRRRQCFTARPEAGAGPGTRRAITRYQSIASRAGLTAVAVALETGRTHQIRVHLAEQGAPVVGDGLYGPARPWPALVPCDGAGPPPAPPPPGALALHALWLELRHPRSGSPLTFQAPPPPYLAALVAAVRGPAAA